MTAGAEHTDVLVGQCLSASEVEALVSGGDVAADRSLHLNRCTVCQEIVEHARAFDPREAIKTLQERTASVGSSLGLRIVAASGVVSIMLATLFGVSTYVRGLNSALRYEERRAIAAESRLAELNSKAIFAKASLDDAVMEVSEDLRRGALAPEDAKKLRSTLDVARETAVSMHGERSPHVVTVSRKGKTVTLSLQDKSISLKELTSAAKCRPADVAAAAVQAYGRASPDSLVLSVDQAAISDPETLSEVLCASSALISTANVHMTLNPGHEPPAAAAVGNPP